MKVVLQNVAAVKGGAATVAALVKNVQRGGDSAANDFNLAEFSEADKAENLRGESYDIKIYPASQKEIADKIVPDAFRGLIMERRDGSLLAAIPENKDLTAEIKAALERENRFLTVKKLKDTADARLKIELRVVPARVELDGAGRIKTARAWGEVPRGAGGQPELKVGDYIMLEVENRGELDVYVTILNLRPDGKIAPGFPQSIEGTPDNFIKKGQKLLIPMPYIFQISEPLGEESFRAIATIEPTDFTPLIDEDLIKRGDGRGARGETAAKTPLGQILIAAQGGKRAGLAASVPPSWATGSFTYTVKAK